MEIVWRLDETCLTEEGLLENGNLCFRKRNGWLVPQELSRLSTNEAGMKLVLKE